MTDTGRAPARELARKHLEAGDPLGWFEELYARAGGDASAVPWAELEPNPNLVEWLECSRLAGLGRKALKIGSGLGDDAEELARRGFETTAFDISESAVVWTHRRFPQSPVDYLVADVLEPPAQWRGAFDLVVESYTLQVLPPDLRRRAMEQLVSFLAPSAALLVIARGREPDDPEGQMPWPLIRAELTAFVDLGLREASFEDYMDSEAPPVRRFRVVYTRS